MRTGIPARGVSKSLSYLLRDDDKYRGKGGDDLPLPPISCCCTQRGPPGSAAQPSVSMALKPISSLVIDTYRSGTELLVKLEGKLVLENSEAARLQMEALLEDGLETAYFHLGKVQYVDSGGWGAMVGLKVVANRNRIRICFLSPTERVLEVFRISKLDSIFDVVEASEADQIVEKIEKPENLVFRGSRDQRQGKYNTEAYFVQPKIEIVNPSDTSADQDPNAEKELRRLSREAMELLKTGDFDRVIETYHMLLDLDPGDITALNNLGIVYEKRPDWHNQAIEVWEKVLDLSEERQDPKHVERAKRHLVTLQGNSKR